MGAEVDKALFQRLHVFLCGVRLRDAAVIFQRTQRGYDHDRIRAQASQTALDIKELFRAEVGAKSRLRDAVIPQLEGRARGAHGVAPVCNVGERAAVHEHRRILQRLDQIRVQGVLEQNRHRADRLQIARIDGRPIICIGHQNPPQPPLEVVHIVRQTEDRHNLAGHSDNKMILAHHAVRLAAHTDDDIAQGTVVHIEAPLKQDAPWVDIQRVPLL